jgi:hypothetical protein
MNWYPSLIDEMLVFPRGQHDDQVDAMAYIGLALDKVIMAPTKEELDDEEYEREYGNTLFEGQSVYTGY